MQHARWSFRIAVVITCCLLASAAWAQGRQLVGHVQPYQAETPHPYPLGAEHRPGVWTDRILIPGATFLRIHFTGFSLADGDYVTVSSPDGSQQWTYAGRGPQGHGSVWSFAILGEEAIVTLHAGLNPGHGYRISQVGVGGVPFRPTPEVVCGLDGREDVACHLPEIDAAQKPVARLLFVSGAFQYVCTGWLVDGSNPNTMMTNNHCFSTQNEVDTVQALFNFQRSTCGGSTNNQTTSYAGGTLLHTNNVDRRGSREGLDYTLLTLQGNPEATWGELTATSTPPAVGELIWFIQHPGGGVKKVGYYEDVVGGARCDIDAVNQTYARSATGSQAAYACDSEGGSSGSPIVRATTGRVMALHHFGGVTNNPCLNAGTQMNAICADAGSLLNCVGEGGGACTLLPSGAACNDNSECCSGNCKGRPGAKTCK